MTDQTHNSSSDQVRADENRNSNRTSTLYRVDLTNTTEHLAAIELQLAVAEGDSPLLRFPVWTPGSYLVREYSRNITSISAHTNNQPVHLVREGKNAYRIPPDESQRIVTVQYEIFCRENTVRTNWLDEDYGFLVGAATFFEVMGREDEPISIHLLAPEEWKSLATSLKSTTPPDTTTPDHAARACIEHQLTANHFDELIDSPILCGNFPIQPFEVAEKQHFFANMGGDNLWDYPTAVADMTSIVEHHQQFWGDAPYEPYWFINLCTESRGGLEHNDSTVLMSGRRAMIDRNDYVDWLGLVSHEFFHTWNVRRLRPKTLMNYDYGHEQHFKELWIAEGITSYFDDLALTHCGLCTEEEFLTRWSKTIRVVQTAPGRKLQSLADSSWDAWTKLYRQDAYSKNSQISYYSKGALLAWVLDIRLRKLTNQDCSLRDVMRLLWTRHLKTGYTLNDFEAIVEELAGRELADWLHAHVVHPQELELEEACNWLGLEFGHSPEPNCIERLGCHVAVENGRFKVAQVLRDSAAAAAGLQVDDELLGLDQYRVDQAQWKRLLNTQDTENPVELLIDRRGRFHRVQLTVPKQSIHDWELQSKTDQTEEQISNRKCWLGMA